MMTGHLVWELSKSVSWLNPSDKKSEKIQTYFVFTPKANEDKGSIDKFHREDIITSTEWMFQIIRSHSASKYTLLM